MKKKTGATPLVPVGGTKDSPLYSRLYNRDYRGSQPGVKPLSPPVNSNTRAIEGCGVILDYRQHERYAREDTYERGDTKLTVRGERIPYGRGDKVDGDIDLVGTEEEEKPTKPPQSAQLAPTWNPYGPKSPIQVSSRNLLDAYTAEGHDSQLAYILDAGRSDRRSIVLNSTNMASTQGGHGLEPHPELHGCTTVTRSSRGQSSNSH
uniref:Uncharacterized protein n=1 Tax=Oryza sativa subsp. japonica TaxID=39947 RepID=Q6YZM7_ORYSJ|nr:hypothetical protein [Oryza sativa Japonica Group]